MMKNLVLLVVLAWVGFSYAKQPVQQESMADADSYKVEKAVEEQDAKRSVAGSKIKKDKTKSKDVEVKEKDSNEESDSEVRYWEYSE